MFLPKYSALILVILLIFVNVDKTVQQIDSLLDFAINFLSDGQRNLNMEFPDTPRVLPEYDFVIIGAGSAGCVLARRLSEMKNERVLLIEAGGRENLLMDIPNFVHYLQDYNVNWKYKTVKSNSSCLGMVNNQCNWPRGKVMGGSSVLNYMVYTRGNRRDYDNWAAAGNPGWSYKDVAPYFKKLENVKVVDAAPGYGGKGGPVTISSIKWKTPNARAFVEAGIETGYPYVDYNGPTQIGYSFLQTNIKKGYRQSSNVAYLYPIHNRKNLHVKKNAHVTNIIIDEITKTAKGVRFMSKGKYYEVKARKEVILSAGAINSPQILMLSGIGPRDELLRHNIKPIVDLKVGYNLQDHQAPGGLTFVTNTSTLQLQRFMNIKNLQYYQKTGEGPIAIPGGVEAIAFYDSEDPKNPDGYPDIELLHLGGAIDGHPSLRGNFGLKLPIYEQMYANLLNGKENGFMIFPMILRPKSRGRITLRSASPFQHPDIDPNYYADPYDMDVSIRGIRKVLELMNTNAFKKINGRLMETKLPNCAQLEDNSDAYWECFTRHFTFTIYHHVGTCKMGPANDTDAVVDSRLRVHGINRLRVIDASIIPDIVSGHTNGPTMMIAERASDLIKQDWDYQKTEK